MIAVNPYDWHELAILNNLCSKMFSHLEDIIQRKNNLTILVFEQSALVFIPGPSIPPRIAAEFLFLKVHFDLVKEIHKWGVKIVEVQTVYPIVEESQPHFWSRVNKLSMDFLC